MKPPPRAPSWIYTGNGRGYDFVNLDKVRDGRACMRSDGVEFSYTIDEQGQCALSGRAAEDVIAHLVMVGTDVTGAAEVLRDRLGQNISESLKSLYTLEEDQLEAFHRGEIGISDAGAELEPGLCETCDAGTECSEYRTGRTGTCEGHTERHEYKSAYHNPATDCAHSDKEECDDCNDCGAVLPPIPLEELARDLAEERNPAPDPDPEVAAMDERIANSSACNKSTNCLDCLKVDQPSCTWSNAGPAPCPGFERVPFIGSREELENYIEVLDVAADIVGTSANRSDCWYGEECHRFPRCFGCSLSNLRDRTSPALPADVLEVTGATSEELIERVRMCGVFRGLQQRGALFGKDYCNVGHEMKEPACACCEYLRISSEGVR